jgi:hypothetical protein
MSVWYVVCKPLSTAPIPRASDILERVFLSRVHVYEPCRALSIKHAINQVLRSLLDSASLQRDNLPVVLYGRESVLYGGRTWSGLIWLRKGPGGWLLWTRRLPNIWVLKRQTVSWLSERLSAVHSVVQDDEIVGSNPAYGMDICICLYVVLSCVGSGLASGWSPD